jgi:hypothetical protein
MARATPYLACGWFWPPSTVGLGVAEPPLRPLEVAIGHRSGLTTPGPAIGGGRNHPKAKRG